MEMTQVKDFKGFKDFIFHMIISEHHPENADMNVEWK